MPAELIYLNANLCEKILVEGDGVPSLIRLLDLIFIDSSVPPESRAPFPVSLMATARFSPAITRNYQAKVKLIRSNGEIVPIGESTIVPAEFKYPGAPSGFNIQLQFGIVPKTMGTCFISVSIEDVEVKIPITFLVQQQLEPENSQK